jgi:glycogen synthase
VKLLLYSHFFAPSVGGVETVTMSLAAGLSQLRNSQGQPEFEVTVVTQTPASSFQDSTLPFAVVRRPRLAKLLHLIRTADIIHVAGPALAPLVLSLFWRKVLVVEHHGFQTVCPNGQLLQEPGGRPCPGHFRAGRHGECLRCNAGEGWIASFRLWSLTFLRRFLCRRVSANIMPTGWLGGIVELPRACTIPHGLGDREKLMRAQADSSPTPLVVFQGRLVSTKGLVVLFEAARMLLEQNRPLQLCIIGDGPQRGELERRAAEPPLAGHVRFLGRLPDEDLEAVMAGSSAVVVPSLGGEVFGLVVAENMQRGLPVLASDLGAFAEIGGNTIVTFRTGDSRDLAQQLAAILDEPEKSAERAREASLRIRERFSLSSMVGAHAEIYRRLCV